MSFNSLPFLVFFPIVLAIYFLMPNRWCRAWLLLASYLFYAAFIPAFLLLLLASTLVDYVAGRAMAAPSAPRQKRAWLMVSLLVNLGLLCAFKYAGLLVFTVDQVAALLSGEGGASTVLASVVVPIGISFYTFQTLGYVIDVYRGDVRAESNLLRFALYVAYFPQLVAGPIERAKRLIPQLAERKAFDAARLMDGLQLMAWGFFKKLVIADRAALLVEPAFSRPGAVGSMQVLLGLYAFAIQIYADFSGYTDIARGASRCLGIELCINFKRPYSADSLRDFWRRWHISLSTWFRDYLYVPLGGSRKGLARQCLAILVVFLVGGLWHGASWMFVLWGAVHATLLVGEAVAGHLFRPRAVSSWWGRLCRQCVVFHLVTLAWIPFRATSLDEAAAIWRVLWGTSASVTEHVPVLAWPGVTVLGLALGVMLFVERLAEDPRWVQRIQRGHAWQQWGLLCLLGALVFLFGVTETRTFIYFQF
ncbi:MAG: MBOAT family protein [Kiritimatiellae bacterium]|nr:MBOAT family protein [Kiritimatiellia bacterium]